MSHDPWFDKRGPADAVLEIEFDADENGGLMRGIGALGPWFGLPLQPTLPSPNAWDCRIVIEGLVLAPAVTYRVDAYFLSPDEASHFLPEDGTFDMIPGHIVGRGTVIEWRDR